LPELIDTEIRKETAVLVGVITRQETEEKVEEYLNELAFLADTAGAIPVKRFVQKLEMHNPKTFVGSGKLYDIKDFVKENKIDIAIFDDELNPSQIRNLEKILS